MITETSTIKHKIRNGKGLKNRSYIAKTLFEIINLGTTINISDVK